MFIDNMSGAQLLKEYNADLPELRELALRFDGSDYVTKYLKKRQKQDYVVITKTFKASRGNRYIGISIYTQRGAGKMRQWYWNSFHVGLMNTYKGISTIVFYAESQQAIVFTPHFFKRYKERFSKVCDWQTRNKFDLAKSIEDIISIYISRNIGISWMETGSVFSHRTHIFAPTNDGVALLQWDKEKRLLQANTFVTMDMLNERQREMVRYSEIYLSLSEEERKKFRFPDFMQNDETQRD